MFIVGNNGAGSGALSYLTSKPGTFLGGTVPGNQELVSCFGHTDNDGKEWLFVGDVDGDIWKAHINNGSYPTLSWSKLDIHCTVADTTGLDINGIFASRFKDNYAVFAVGEDHRSFIYEKTDDYLDEFSIFRDLTWRELQGYTWEECEDITWEEGFQTNSRVNVEIKKWASGGGEPSFWDLHVEGGELTNFSNLRQSFILQTPQALRPDLLVLNDESFLRAKKITLSGTAVTTTNPESPTSIYFYEGNDEKTFQSQPAITVQSKYDTECNWPIVGLANSIDNTSFDILAWSLNTDTTVATTLSFIAEGF